MITKSMLNSDLTFISLLSFQANSLDDFLNDYVNMRWGVFKRKYHIRQTEENFNARVRRSYNSLGTTQVYQTQASKIKKAYDDRNKKKAAKKKKPLPKNAKKGPKYPYTFTLTHGANKASCQIDQAAQKYSMGMEYFGDCSYYMPDSGHMIEVFEYAFEKYIISDIRGSISLRFTIEIQTQMFTSVFSSQRKYYQSRQDFFDEMYDEFEKLLQKITSVLIIGCNLYVEDFF